MDTMVKTLTSSTAKLTKWFKITATVKALAPSNLHKCFPKVACLTQKEAQLLNIKILPLSIGIS